jgi:molecular chaperone HscB
MQCEKKLDSPIACSGCGALTDLPADTFNCFEVFGLEPTFDVDVDALHRKYLELSRLIHPDLAGGPEESGRRRSLALSARFNQAYEVLRDPTRRAEYLLRLLGGATCCEDRSVPEDLLEQVMEMRERVEAAVAAGDRESLRGLADEVRALHGRAKRSTAELARKLTQGERDEGTGRSLRQQLNALKYWDGLRERIAAAR